MSCVEAEIPVQIGALLGFVVHRFRFRTFDSVVTYGVSVGFFDILVSKGGELDIGILILACAELENLTSLRSPCLAFC